MLNQIEFNSIEFYLFHFILYSILQYHYNVLLSSADALVMNSNIIIILRREPLPDEGRFRGHSLYFKGHCLVKSQIHHWFT